MIKILANPFSFPSAKILRDGIVERTGAKIIVTSHPERIHNGDIVIRYGNSLPCNSFAIETGINTREFISTVSNKLRFSNLMQSAGIYSPVFSKEQPEEFPVMIRESLTSSGGKGIHIASSMEEFSGIFNNYFYWTKFIMLDFELRVHVVNGNIVRIFKKEENFDQEFPIRNNAVCHFALKDNETYPKLKPIISKISEIELFKRQVFGLDIAWDKKKQEYFVIEINSAPGLNEHTCEFYADYISSKLREEK